PLDEMPQWVQYDVARNVYAGLMQPVPFHTPQGVVDFGRAFNQPLTRLDGARMVHRRARVMQEESATEALQTPRIPAGTQMVISPTAAISAEQLFVGQMIYFSLVNPIDIAALTVTIPRGTRLHGRVIEISSDRQRAEVVLDKAH